MNSPRPIPDNLDMAIMTSLQTGIELKDEPYRDVARNLGLSQEEILSRIRMLDEAGVIRRFGASINPSKIGFQANGMVVCKVPRERLTEVGRQLADVKEVTHCYERETVPGVWSYNLFFMIHGPTRRSVEEIVATLTRKLAIEEYEIIFSVKELKKTSLTLQEKSSP